MEDLVRRLMATFFTFEVPYEQWFRAWNVVFADSHAHLSEFPEATLSKMLGLADLTVFSNSVDLDSSSRTLILSRKFGARVIPFVGIHPEIFAAPHNPVQDRTSIDSLVETLASLLAKSAGIGEIGMDPKYGRLELQDYLLEKMLKLAESTALPVTLHNRNSASQILGKMSSFDLKGKVLFHWFAGAGQELSRITDLGMYCSFGPSLIFSKRLSRLLSASNPDLVLAETDAPTPFSFLQADGTPMLVASVIFKMASVLKISFEEMREKVLQNSNAYLRTQTSLRVKEN